MKRVGRETAAQVYPPLRRVGTAVALVLGLAVGPTTAAAQGTVIDRLVAVVEQRALMQSDLQLARRLGSLGAATPGASAAEQLVARELMRLEVERFAVVDPPPEAVEARLIALADGQPVETWLASLAPLGLSPAVVRRRVIDDLRIAAYLDQRFAAAAQPTEVEVVERARADGAGAPVPAFALAAARAALSAERRATLVADWVEGLRRRASVRVVPTP